MSGHPFPRPGHPLVAYVRPRSAAVLVPADDDPGQGRVERLLHLARTILP